MNRSSWKSPFPAAPISRPRKRGLRAALVALSWIPAVAGAASLDWVGDQPGAHWQVGGSSNWLLNGVKSPFTNGDAVNFGNHAVSWTPVIIGAVQPGSVTVGGTNDYLVSGAGRIEGAAGLRKEGTNTLTIANANSFTGPVVVDNGVLRYGVAGALGAAAGYVYVTNNGSLDLNKTDPGLRTLVIAGAGYADQGAIINSSTDGGVNNLVGSIMLLRDATISSVGRWNVKPGGTVAGNGRKLTKTGPGSVWLYRCGATGLGDIELAEGTLGAYPPVDLGDPARTLTAQPGTTLSLWRTTDNEPPFELNKRLVLNRATISSGFTPANGGSNVFSGPIILNLTNTCNASSADLHLSNRLSGGGGLIKIGARTLFLHAPGAYTGPTLINAGRVVLGPQGSLASQLIQVSAGATLEVAGAGLSLGAGQKLGGNQGVIAGNVVIGSGATLHTSLSDQRTWTLQITGHLEFQPGGTNRVVVHKTSTLANNLVAGLASVKIGGTLLIITSGDPLAAGDELILFDAAQYRGAFEQIIPAAPGLGLSWDASSLPVDGVLRVKADGDWTPAGITVRREDDQMFLSWPPSHSGWVLQAQTNPPGVGLGTNWAAVEGSPRGQEASARLDPAVGSVFYRLAPPVTLRVGTYNVGHFNQGSLGGYPGSDPAAAAQRWREWIERQSFDIFFVQEWNSYFDQDGVIPAAQTLLTPSFDRLVFGQANTWIYNGIATRYPLRNLRQVTLTHDQYYVILADWRVAGLTITLGSVHVPWQACCHESSIDALIAELAKYEYVICAGDFNAPDRNALKIKAAGFHMANGGDEGWFCTAAARCATSTTDVHIDNIVTSTNIIIRNVSAPLTGLGDRDHLPLRADLIISR